ncbi:MAG: AAA family ATPase [Candidatus Acidiferrum sp.]
MPPYLAGREDEIEQFDGLLSQDTILKNLVLTGLRGLGKTVLLETFKPMAISKGWLWAGTDLSESTSISEENMALRLLTDLAVATSSIVYKRREKSAVGFSRRREHVDVTLNFNTLKGIYDNIPGLISDKLKGTLEIVWLSMKDSGSRGIIFAYDEAQNLADHAARNQFPLSLLLDLFQSLQRKECRFMLALTGLPTLFPKLVEARTFAERMFTVVFLNPLSEKETTEAIREGIKKGGCPVNILPKSIETIWNFTKGYPYFIQYVCREVFDIWVQASEMGKQPPPVPLEDITRKLDSDFFAGRWARATDRQRELLRVIAELPNCDAEFTVQEIVEHPINKEHLKSFGSSHTNQMLSALSDAGLIYKNRHGKYSFAVPLLGDFIRRQEREFGVSFLPFEEA